MAWFGSVLASRSLALGLLGMEVTAVAGDGEGDWALRTEPRMDSGIWKKEALLAGEAARSGEDWWPCLEAASAAIMSSSSISPATVYGRACYGGR